MKKAAVILIFSALQGITEAFPVSSSVHYKLACLLLHQEPHAFLNILLHGTTLVALLLLFRKVLWRCFWGAWDMVRGAHCTDNCLLLQKIFLATVPTVVVGVMLHFFPLPVQNSWVNAASLGIGGVLLYVADAKGPHLYTKPEELSHKHALLLGVFQSFAFLPGVSRLGISIAGARFLGLSREASINFSFLMALPSLAGAVALAVPSQLSTTFLEDPLLRGTLLGAVALVMVLTPLSVWAFRSLTRRFGFGFIALYRLIIAVILVILDAPWGCL